MISAEKLYQFELKLRNQQVKLRKKLTQLNDDLELLELTLADLLQRRTAK